MSSFKTISKQKKQGWKFACILSLFVAMFALSIWFISSAWFRDQEEFSETVQTGIIEIEGNTQYSMSSVLNLALADQFLLEDDVQFTLTERSSDVYVRCGLKFSSTANALVAKDMVKFQELKLGQNIGYSWSQFGEYFYLTDETGAPKTIKTAEAGKVFTFIERENLILSKDALENKHFTSDDTVTMVVEIEAIQGRNVEDSTNLALNQYYEAQIPADTYTINFYDQSSNLISTQTSDYGDRVVVPEITRQDSTNHVHFAYWSTTEDGDGLKIYEKDEIRVFSNISQNMNVYAVYEHDKVNITVNFSEGGIVTPGDTTIDWGTGKTFRVVADSGYEIVQINRDGVEVHNFQGRKIDAFDYILANVYADTSIEAIFAPVEYDITVIAVGGGAVDPGSIKAEFGSSKVFTITPDNGYRIVSITLDSIDVPVTAAPGSSQRYVMANISSDHVLSVKFANNILTITGIADSNGSVQPNLLQVEYGSFATINIIPNEGYEIDSITVDGSAYGGEIAKGGTSQSVSFENIVQDHEVRATFKKIMLQINASAGEGGVISPSGVIECDYGSTMSFEIRPNAQMAIDVISVDGSEVAVTVTEGDSQIYTFDNIKVSHSIKVTFKKSLIRLNINGGTGVQPTVSYSLDGTKFTLSSNEPTGPAGKEFYYYSTRSADDETGQLGVRYDLGFEYDIPDLNAQTTLYAIYLTPTTDLTVYSRYMVYPKGMASVSKIGLEQLFGGDFESSGNPIVDLVKLLVMLCTSVSVQDTTLEYCTLPPGMTALEMMAFGGCTALKGVSVPASLAQVGWASFAQTVSMKKFDIPLSCLTIQDDAFKNSGITQLNMNKQLQAIGSGAFAGSQIVEFIAPKSMTIFGEVLFSLLDSSGADVFQNCQNLVKIDFSSQSSLYGQSFKDCSSLTTVILPQSITSIDEAQFQNCALLEGVLYKNGNTIIEGFPTTLSSIGNNAFKNCAFTTLDLSNCLEVSIGNNAFENNLFTELKLDSTQIGTVGQAAFASCQNLTRVVWGLPEEVSNQCFQSCGKLTEVQIGKASNNTAGIGISAFDNCLKLETVNFSNIANGFTIRDYAFRNAKLSQISLKEGITSIGVGAFFNNPFVELVFPQTLVTLNATSLQLCLNLRKFELKSPLSETISPNNVGGGVWYIEGEPYQVGTTLSSASEGVGIAGVYITTPGTPDQVDWEWIEIVSSNSYKTYTTTVSNNIPTTTATTITGTLPYGLTIGVGGVEVGSKYLTKYAPHNEVVMQEGASMINIIAPTSIIDSTGTIHEISGIANFAVGNGAASVFTNYPNEVSLVIVNGLEYIATQCFKNTSGAALSSIIVPTSIEYIGTWAFFGTKVAEVDLPNLKFIGAGAFESCSSLTSASLSKYITQIKNHTFAGTSLTGGINLPVKLEVIERYAFSGSKLKAISIPSTVNTIGEGAFYNASYLKNIQGFSGINIAKLENFTFKNCSSLQKLYLPSTCIEIGESAFENCTSLVDFSFGQFTKTIGENALYQCSSIQNISIPSSVTSIGATAFSNNSNLIEINVMHNAIDGYLTIGDDAFASISPEVKVYVNNNVELADFKTQFDNKAFPDGALLLRTSDQSSIAKCKSEIWLAVRRVEIYVGDGGSATINMTEQGVTMSYTVYAGALMTFNVVEGSIYTVSAQPDPTTTLKAIVINSDIYTSSPVANKTVDQDIEITVTFDKPIVTLDPNGGNANHTLIENTYKTEFTIGGDSDSFKNGDRDFYFYSTNATDNESNQIGKRFDVGVTYTVEDLNGVKVLYAIYLKPTAVNYTISSGKISLSTSAKSETIINLVIPKKVNGNVVTGIADLGFSRAAVSGLITSNSIVNGLITMPSTVTSIGKRAFAGNIGINLTFSLPYGLASMSQEAFALTNFTSINTNKLISSTQYKGIYENIVYTTDGVYQSIISKQISSVSSFLAGYTNIMPHAFAGSTLTMFDDAGLITNYGEYAFADATLLNEFRLSKPASSVTFGTGMFAGTTSQLKFYVPAGQVEAYMNKLTSALSINNGALIYNGLDNRTRPYAQYYEGEWIKIYKVTVGNTGSGDSKVNITISNTSAQANNDNTFIAYKAAFGGNIDGFYRADWIVAVAIQSNIQKGYKVSEVRLNNVVQNMSTLGSFNTKGDIYSFVMAANTRTEDIEVSATSQLITNLVTVYSTANGTFNTAGLTAGSNVSMESKTYTTHTKNVVYGKSFVLNEIKPNTTYAMASIRMRVYEYDENSNGYVAGPWQNIDIALIRTSSTLGIEQVSTIDQSIQLRTDFAIDFVYAPVITNIANVYAPLNMSYDSDKKSYTTISGLTPLASTYTSITINNHYESLKNGSNELYYFTNNNNRFDTGIAYAKANFAYVNNYTILTAKFFAPIKNGYSISGNTLTITSNISLSEAQAFPKGITTINNSGLLEVSGSITLPRSVTTLGGNAFVMAKITRDIYLPTNLKSINEGGLAINGSATFNQTRVGSGYNFTIADNAGHIYTSLTGTLLAANTSFDLDDLDASEFTKLGAYVFGGRNFSTYTDANNDITAYGEGAFYNCANLKTLTFTKASSSVSFNGNLIGSSASKEKIYVADTGYVSKLNGRGFFETTLSGQTSSNPFSTMYVGDKLYAVNVDDDGWTVVYGFTFEYNSAQVANKINSDYFVENNVYYSTINLVNFTATAKDYYKIDRIEYVREDDVVDSVTYSADTFEYDLPCSTTIQIVSSLKVYNVTIEFVEDRTNQSITTEIFQQLAGSGLADAVGLNILNDEGLVSQSINKGTYVLAMSHGVNVNFSLAPKSILYITNISGIKSITPVYPDAEFANEIEFGNFNVIESTTTTITVTLGVAPIRLHKNYGTGGSLPSITYSNMSLSGNELTFNFNIGTSDLKHTLNSQAYIYYYSNSASATDFSDLRFDYSCSYSTTLSKQSGAFSSVILYARYAQASSNWGFEDGSKLTYSGTGAGGTFYSGNSAVTTNIIVVPQYIGGNVTNGLEVNCFGSLSSGSNYVLMPNNTSSFSLPHTAFRTSNNSNIKAISLGSSTSSITAGAFRYLSGLEKIVLYPNNSSAYRSLNGALYNSSLNMLVAHPQKLTLVAGTTELVTLKTNSLTIVSDYACEDLQASSSSSLSLPYVTNIRSYAFASAKGITSITLRNCQSIGDRAFDLNTVIQTISNTGSIGQYAFNGCTNLTTVTNAGAIGNYAFNGCSKLSSISFTSSCSSIGEQAFNGCSSIKELTISSMARLTLSEEAIYNMSGLRELTLNPTTALTFEGSSTISSCPKLYLVYISKDLSSSYSISKFSTGLTWYYSSTLPIPSSASSVTYLKTTGYYSCQTPGFFEWIVENVTYNSTRTDITDRSSISSASIVGYVGSSTTVTVPASLRYDTDTTFTIKTVKYLDQSGNGTGAIKNGFMILSFASGITTIGDGSKTIMGTPAGRLYSVNFPATVTQIKDHAFNGCSEIRRVNINNANVGAYAFYNCSRISEITIGSGSIGAYGFGNSYISIINISVSTPPSVHANAFVGSMEQVKVYIPKFSDRDNFLNFTNNGFTDAKASSGVDTGLGAEMWTDNYSDAHIAYTQWGNRRIARYFGGRWVKTWIVSGIRCLNAQSDEDYCSLTSSNESHLLIFKGNISAVFVSMAQFMRADNPNRTYEVLDGNAYTFNAYRRSGSIAWTKLQIICNGEIVAKKGDFTDNNIGSLPSKHKRSYYTMIVTSDVEFWANTGSSNWTGQWNYHSVD